MPSPVFQPEPLYSARRRVKASTEDCQYISVSARGIYVGLHFGHGALSIAADLRPELARALAAELIASADAIDTGDQS